jgi:hypothetical protein
MHEDFSDLLVVSDLFTFSRCDSRSSCLTKFNGTFPSQIILISDLTPTYFLKFFQGPLNPLLGPVLAAPFDTRFVPLSKAYSFSLRKDVFRAAHSLGFPREALAEGTYAWVSGPTYETPAEGRFLRAAGADVVGMSTIPEVVRILDHLYQLYNLTGGFFGPLLICQIAAHQAGMQVLVLSLVTNSVVIPDKYVSPREEFESEVRSDFYHTPPTFDLILKPTQKNRSWPESPLKWNNRMRSRTRRCLM